MKFRGIHLPYTQESLWRAASNLLLVSLWFWFYLPIVPYLRVIFTREEFRTNQIVLFAAGILIFLQLRRGKFKPRLDLQAQYYLPALILATVGSIIFLINERFLEINTLSASMFALASDGLLGVWMRPQRWKQGLPAVLLLVGAFPFGEHMHMFVGYPVRNLIAGLVSGGLAALGVNSISVDTILVFENGITQVDLHCSGVKSLWTGGLFLIAVTWIEHRNINLRWLLTALVFMLLLPTANLVRVPILVAVGQVFEWQLLAEMLHIPLGVLGILATCAASVWMLRFKQPENNTP